MAEAKITDGPIIRAINKAGPAGHERGGELEQIKFLLGHMSVQTMERYLGCKHRQRFNRDRAGVDSHLTLADLQTLILLGFRVAEGNPLLRSRLVSRARREDITFSRETRWHPSGPA